MFRRHIGGTRDQVAPHVAAHLQFVSPFLRVNRLGIVYRFFYAVSLPLLAAAVGVELVLMPVRGTSALVLLDVGLAWFAALSTLVLVPTDVASALQVQKVSF
jgi:hypothetical protein